jgi:hypothetical protein
VGVSCTLSSRFMKGDRIPPTPASLLSERGTTFFTERWCGMLRELLDQLFDASEELVFGARVVGEA